MGFRVGPPIASIATNTIPGSLAIIIVYYATNSYSY